MAMAHTFLKHLEPISKSIKLTVTPDQAFTVFTSQIHLWWPQAYTWAKETLVEFKIQPQKDGRCTEIGSHGFTCDWGRILEWEPPKKLVLAWQIDPGRVPQPNSEKASEVVISFLEDGSDKTSVNLVHRHLNRHGEDSPKYRDDLDSEYGWDYLLKLYAEKVIELYPTLSKAGPHI